MMVMSQGAEVTVSPFTVKVAVSKTSSFRRAERLQPGNLLGSTRSTGTRPNPGHGDRAVVIALRPVGSDFFAVHCSSNSPCRTRTRRWSQRSAQRSGQSGACRCYSRWSSRSCPHPESLHGSRSVGGVSMRTNDDAALRNASAAAPSSISNQELVYMTSMVTFGTMERMPRKKAV